jgi:signal transduction histidine kinase
LLEHDETEQAAVRLRSAEETARQSLLEMRRLVGLLDLGDDPDLHPQPGVADLDALISQVRAAGVPVELRVCGEERPVTPGLGLAVYRIVQEALTNVIKHAAGAPTTVSVEYRPHDLLVEVRDAGAHTNRGEGDGGARGVAGMRARAALYGGRLIAAAGEPGGFRVAAELPFET